MIPGVTVVIPSIPPREALRERAAGSAWAALQRLDASGLLPERSGTGVLIVQDSARKGAARTRHLGLTQVQTEYVAFLDDDDVMLPDHLEKLYGAAVEHQADYLWSRFVIVHSDGSLQPGPAFLGEKAFRQWDDNDPCQTTITTLVRTELALDVGGFEQFDDTGELIDGQRRGEDFEFTMRCREGGAEFRHVPAVTWHWFHHGANTSGLPDRW
jgi:glycosyltransferase involved in cell wall biosynthesis